MNHKFDKVAVDTETKILFSAIQTFDGYDVRYEKWLWDGVYGESLIFFNEDVNEAFNENLSENIGESYEDQLTRALHESALVESGSQITVQRAELYTFFNFNFKNNDC